MRPYRTRVRRMRPGRAAGSRKTDGTIRQAYRDEDVTRAKAYADRIARDAGRQN